MSERSEIRDGMLIEWDMPIEVNDGVVLRADVFRPVGNGQWPVILSHGPYAKGLHFADGYPDQWRIMCREHPDVPAGSSNSYQAWEVADPEKWVPHGYACVRVDSRGTGRSPGYLQPFSPQETRDFHECIEWAGTRAWSNGRVGLSGISYYGMNQWQVAATQPAHLAAMCVWEGAADWYRDATRHGGMLSTFWANWYEHQVKTVQYGLGKNGPTSRATGELVCGDETLDEDELRANRTDFGAELRAHPFVDDYYAERIPDFSRITTPLLSSGNWGGYGLHLRGNTNGFARVASPRKWLEMHGLAHWVHYYTDYGREIQKAFFDHFLRGEDNGWDRRPRSLLNIRHIDGRFERRDEDDWPSPRTSWTKLYLNPCGRRLDETPPSAPATSHYDAAGDGVVFTTVLGEETEITGPASARLWISSSTTDADIFLILRVFDPEGTEVTFQGALDPHTPIAHGWLRASHRRLNAEFSTDSQPYHSHDRSEPLVPGRIYEVAIEIWPTCLVVPAGYKLALAVQGVDYCYSEEIERVGWFTMNGVGPFKHDDPGDRPHDIFSGTITLHAGPDMQPHLLLPVIPR